jgi:putative acetyltransferase
MGPPMLEIRQPLTSEFDLLGQIFHEAVHQVAKQDYAPEQLRAWAPAMLGAEHWRRRTTGLEVRVGVMGGEVAGFIGFSPSGYVDLLFTRPAYLRRGVARGLLLDAERFLLRAGVRTATTQASLTARPFFEALGYTWSRDQTATCRGVGLRNFCMEKFLETPR